ncbi:MAG: ThiF family adenylyltransferase, partial [Bdellovibrionales bacterium]|nr:ThiF family adenylyltransferase [Bdellovibrionales bacterium]
AFSKISELMGDDFKRRVLENDGTPRSLINIYINGKNAKFSGGMQTSLKDGDEVYILPAVAGGSEDLSAKELDRFSRQVMLEEIGYQGQLKLKNAKVCVVGTGGLGNPITSRLAAMGVGTLRIIDRDVIELSNLHRQTMFDEEDVGQIKVEVAAKKLKRLNPDCKIEALAISVNDYTALEAVEGCDVVIDALDSVNARYALNKACVQFGIPFVTGAAVGVSGQAFTILPKKTACYYCMFPDLNEDTMPTCSIEGVHPSILSIVGGIEVAEAVKIILGKKPSLSERILHIDLENLEFTSTRTFRAEECPICGTGKLEDVPKEELILEELCGRNRGKRTYSITPTETFDLDVAYVTGKAKENGFLVENQGSLGLSLRTNDMSV